MNEKSNVSRRKLPLKTSKMSKNEDIVNVSDSSESENNDKSKQELSDFSKKYKSRKNKPKMVDDYSNDEEIVEKTPTKGLRKSSRKITPGKRLMQDLEVSDSTSDSETEMKASPPKPRRSRAPSIKALENMAIDNNEETPENSPIKPTRKSTRKVSPLKRYIVDSEEAGSSKLPKTPKTPKKHITKIEPKTPHALRSKIHKKLKQMTIRDSTESDFSGSESDFVPDENDSSETDNSSAEYDNEDEPTSYNSKSDRKIPMLDFNVDPLARTRYKSKDYYLNDFILQSDEFFSSHASGKSLTSDRTLDCLKNPRLQQDELFKLLSAMKISAEHEKCIKEMVTEYKLFFKKWLFLLDENFSILLYGLGSKMNLLQSFQKEMLADQDVLVVNGFFPSLSIKDVLDNLANKLLELEIPTANLNTCVDLIEEFFDEYKGRHVFLLVHNIDGVMLRNDKSQMVLSRLAKIKNVHLLASLDHINGPMLWNPAKLANFNFTWWDVTTMLPYTEETAYENSLLVQNSGALALSSMKNVFQSLTTNAKGIYMIIVKYQTTNKENSHYQGMPFKELYSKCRESFLVSSDLALRAQLTEFLDHKLVKSKRSADGTENLNIPIENQLLQQFLDQQNG